MKVSVAAIFLVLFSCSVLKAQELPSEPVSPAPQLDSALVGSSIFNIMPSGVAIRQSSSVRQAFDGLVISNTEKQFNGYRIRIYFNSVQTAREESRAALNRFQYSFPEIPAYLSYSSPNFRVTVGNFRTRVDAEKALVLIKEEFPSATIIRDKFKYPTL